MILSSPVCYPPLSSPHLLSFTILFCPPLIWHPLLSSPVCSPLILLSSALLLLYPHLLSFTILFCPPLIWHPFLSSPVCSPLILFSSALLPYSLLSFPHLPSSLLLLYPPLICSPPLFSLILLSSALLSYSLLSSPHVCLYIFYRFSTKRKFPWTKRKTNNDIQWLLS